ncbi:hypothetical protein [Bacillus thuringiensis]|nr:hypothetical protein [Bacillus thuringiensis]
MKQKFVSFLLLMWSSIGRWSFSAFYWFLQLQRRPAFKAGKELKEAVK